jgi:hypothetical protein
MIVKAAIRKVPCRLIATAVAAIGMAGLAAQVQAQVLGPGKLRSAQEIAQASAAQAAQASGVVRVIVAFKPGTAANVKAAVAAARGSVKHEIFGMNAMAIEVPTQALKGLKNNPNVEYVEEDVIRNPFALTTPSTGTRTPPASWSRTASSWCRPTSCRTNAMAYNRKVCIIDSGVDQKHEDLAANGVNVTGEYDAGTGWWYTDENHHGTHVAGTIAAINNSGVGVVGVNPNKQLKLHIVKVFGNAGRLGLFVDPGRRRPTSAARGANVISMSLGGGRASMTEQRAFDKLQTKGVLSDRRGRQRRHHRRVLPGRLCQRDVGGGPGREQGGPRSRSTTATSRSPVPASTCCRPCRWAPARRPAPERGRQGLRRQPDGRLAEVKSATAPLADFGIGDTVNTAPSRARSA